MFDEATSANAQQLDKGILRMTALPASFRLQGGIEIPIIGFGTYPIPNEEAGEAVRHAITLGYRHIDTAEIYQNEEGVGKGIRLGLEEAGIPRTEVFVTTKLWPGGVEPGEKPKSRAATLAAFDESLSKLGLEYIDLYLIHSPHAGEGRIEQWAALLELKKRGKVCAVGVSNYGRAHIEEIAAAGLELPAANQLELHPWSQKPALTAYLHEKRIEVIAYSSLAPLSTWRRDQNGPSSDRTETAEASFVSMARKYSVSEAQLLLRWGVQNGFAVLPKSTSPSRMRENRDLFDFSINDDDMAALAGMDRDVVLAWPDGDPTRIA